MIGAPDWRSPLERLQERNGYREDGFVLEGRSEEDAVMVCLGCGGVDTDEVNEEQGVRRCTTDGCESSEEI